ncbi:hypothetical protein CDD81_3910 [Ophiocordyceps australis]|uniref:Uncharacterized protein n=1 Tax=Ophiocordyceps australis TaxID=1399860 RepID=A0A2C5YD07_9HYPO|nr:hypothetical protein CDD81_3910 [Ophiocordyceps australis]
MLDMHWLLLATAGYGWPPLAATGTGYPCLILLLITLLITPPLFTPRAESALHTLAAPPSTSALAPLGPSKEASTCAHRAKAAAAADDEAYALPECYIHAVMSVSADTTRHDRRHGHAAAPPNDGGDDAATHGPMFVSKKSVVVGSSAAQPPWLSGSAASLFFFPP